MISYFYKFLLFALLSVSAVFIPLHVTAQGMTRPPFVADWATYVRYSGDTMTFRWQHEKAGGEIKHYGGDSPTEFKIDVYHWERDQVIITGTVSAFDDLSFPVTFPASGHYRISVRACNSAGCSDPCHSTAIDCGTIDNAPSPFWIYATVKPVGNISID